MKMKHDRRQVRRQILSQSWALDVFLNFFNNKKWFFAFFIKLTWLGVGFLNRTGAEIGINLIENAKNSFFLLKKLKNTESAQLWILTYRKRTQHTFEGLKCVDGGQGQA